MTFRMFELISVIKIMKIVSKPLFIFISLATIGKSKDHSYNEEMKLTMTFNIFKLKSINENN